MLDFLGSIIAYPFRWINIISPNYVVTLLLFAVFMKLVLFPFGIKQQKNSVKQAKLRPYETVIRKKYAGRNDKVSQQKLNEELMSLYQRENFNPASGCLPMLVQLPILFALYSVITKPIKFLMQLPDLSTKVAELCKNAGITASYEILQINELLKVSNGTTALSEKATIGLTEINELLQRKEEVNGVTKTLFEHFEELRESFTILNLNLMEQPQIKEPSVLWLIPVFVFLFSFGSMKLTRKFTYQPPQNGADNATAASLKMMDITMPLMSAWISFMTPAGIGIYWIIQNILGVVQQFVLSKLYPIPVMTDEELKNAEKELKGKSKPPKRPTPAISETSQINARLAAKKHNQSKSKPQITKNGKARIKNSGSVPRAIRHPQKTKR